MGFFDQVLCKTRGIAVAAKRRLMFFVPAAGLSDIRLVTIRASQFIYTRLGVFVMGMVFVSKQVV